MKVAFLAGTLARGGAEKQLVYMLRALRQTGVTTRVLCLTRGEAFETEIRDLQIEIDYVGSSPNKIIRLSEIIGNLRRRPADILQSSHFYANIYAALAGRFLKIPQIGAIRNDLKSEIAAHQWLGKWQASLPQQLIANSEVARHRAIALGISPNKIDFVRNAVEVECDFEVKNNSATVLNILFVGRLVRQKRPELFVKLAALVEQTLPNYQINFQIVGDGALRPQLERLADELALQKNRISFLGLQTDMNKIYAQADLLVSTSEHEGTPNAVLEAMAHGIPVVATKVGGVPEILDDKRGFLIQPDDENALVKAITKLISDSALRARFGEQGRSYVEKNHSLKYLQERLSEIYGKLLVRR